MEIVASHGDLPAQFMNPRVNHRADQYGGSFDNRMRFTREAISTIRANVPSEFIVGMRMSGDEHDEDGLVEDDSVAIARALAPELDYLECHCWHLRLRLRVLTQIACPRWQTSMATWRPSPRR